MSKVLAEYIWIDGQKPTQKLRSKTKVLNEPRISRLEDIPCWSFDGSSTDQAAGHSSDCMLRPVALVPDPIRKHPHILVMCQVCTPTGFPHPTNTRAVLRDVAQKFSEQKPLFGVEQEYTLYNKNHPVGWPAGGFPHPQGRYYCGVGTDEVHGRPLVERHLGACLEAGIEIQGTNAEVMPSQWEFQIGALPPLECADQLWLARWLLYRLGEEYGMYAKLDPKPMPGDWNGAGGHTNFSTKEMRTSPGAHLAIVAACKKLEAFHSSNMKVYGADNRLRLTGKHETCRFDEFRFGVGDRGASVRIPAHVETAGCGYLEDRRPAANLDPYQVFTAILETVCGDGFNPTAHGWD